MEVQSCGECGKPVSTLDIEEGGGGTVGGIYFCPGCYHELQAQEAADAPLELLDPPAKQQQARPAPARARSGASGRRKAASGRQKAVSPGTGRHAPASARKKAASGRQRPVPPGTGRHKPASSRRMASASGRRKGVGSGTQAPVSSRRMAAAKSSSGRIATPSGRFQTQSGRYAAPKKSGSGVVVILIIVILALAGGVGYIIMQKQQQAAEENNQNAAAGQETAETETGEKDEGQPETAGTETGETPETGEGETEEATAEQAMEKIVDAIDMLEYEKAYTLASQAVKDFADNEEVAQLLVDAETGLKEANEAIYDEAIQLRNEGRFEESKEMLTALLETSHEEYKIMAREALDGMDEAVTEASAAELDSAAREMYVRAGFYFNDFMEKNDDSEESGQEALTLYTQLLKDYGKTEFIRTKRALIEAAVKLLNGQPLPPIQTK